MTATPPQEPVDSRALLQSAGRGAAWRIAGGAWATVVRLAASMILARHLSPADFGIAAMAFLARDFIWRVGALGMGAGVVAKKDLTQEDLSTAFWTDGTVRLGLFALSFAAAPLVGLFFGAPDVVWVFRAVSVTFLLSAASSVSGTLLYRRMHLGRQETIFAVGVTVESAAAVTLACTTQLAYWSLVIAMLVGSVLTHGLTILAARWRPSFHFSRKSFRFQFRFGAYGLAGSIFEFLEDNIDYLVVGRLWGQGILGLYEFAFRIPTLLHTRLVRPAAGVIFPSLARAQTDRDLVIRGFMKATRLSALMVWPMLAALGALAYPVVLVMWGDQWRAIVPWLQILCVVAAMNSLSTCASPVFMAIHRPDMPLKLQVPKCLAAFAAVATAGHYWGVTGVAWAMAAMSLYYFVLAYAVCRMSGASYARLLGSLSAPTAAALASGLGAWATCQGLLSAGVNLPATLGAGIAAAAACGLGCLYFLLPASYKEIMSLLRTTLGRVAKSGGPA